MLEFGHSGEFVEAVRNSLRVTVYPHIRGGECSFRTVDTLLVKHCDVGMRLRYEIECIGYVGLFRPRTPDSPTTFRLPAGGRGDVIVALEPVQWANNFRLIPYGERPRLYCDTGGAQLGVTVRMA